MRPCDCLSIGRVKKWPTSMGIRIVLSGPCLLIGPYQRISATFSNGTGPSPSRLSARPCPLLPMLTLLTLASGAFAQGKTQLKVDGERIKSYIEYLSTDEMMGRQSMTPGYQVAAEWVAAQYEAWGLEPDSRLSCQAIVTDKELVVEIPRYTINMVSERH